MRYFPVRQGCLVSLVVACACIVPVATASAQSLNHSIDAMEAGDFQRAFSILRQLEQAGDPYARQMMDDVFYSSGAAIAPPQPAPGVAPAPQEAPQPAAMVAPPERPDLSPLNSPRPLARRATPQALAEGFALPAALDPDAFRALDESLARIGRDLFFDPILSGNKDVSCGTCHMPAMASGDGLSLGLGTGAVGLGVERRADGPNAATRRIPRNAPALWNLGARDLRVIFRDGRVEPDPDDPDRFLTPQGPLDYMDLNSVLAAQALFPPTSAEEMAGQPGENEIADAASADLIHGDEGAWGLLAARVDGIAAYHDAFNAYRGADAPVRIDEIANALAAFIEWEFRAIDTPFDRYLREEAALESVAGLGMQLFYGKAGCAGCHSGPLLSDQDFHAMGQPPIGPGRQQGEDGYSRDIGRAAVTQMPEDLYAFRTPMLRNVAVTGPWGHTGAFSELRDFLDHHIDPAAGLARYEPQAVLPMLEDAADDFDRLANETLMSEIRAAAARAMAQRPLVMLDADEVDFLIAFLHALTDEAALDGRMGAPDSVPSGLALAH